MMELFFHGEFLQSDLVRRLLSHCDQNSTMKEFCVNVMFILFGDDYEQFNYVSNNSANVAIEVQLRDDESFDRYVSNRAITL